MGEVRALPGKPGGTEPAMLNQADRNQFYPTIQEASGLPQQSEVGASFRWLATFINQTAGATFLSSRRLANGCWWVMFHIDINHAKTWHVIQEYAHVCYGRTQGVSLPVRFLPFASHPSNGGPDGNLLWRIECYDSSYSPDNLVAELGSFVAKSLVKWPPQGENLT